MGKKAKKAAKRQSAEQDPATQGPVAAAGPAPSPGASILTSYGREALSLSRSYHAYLDARVASLGITGAHVPVLAYLWEARVGNTQNEIARAIGVDKGTVSRSITQLAKLGFVSQTCSSRDSRACFIELTERGRALEEPVGAIAQSWTERVTENMSEKAKSRLLRELQEMRTRSEQLAAGTLAAP